MDDNYYRSLEPFLGEWHIVRKIGDGSESKVFEIEKEELGTRYSSALKIIMIPHSEWEWERIVSEGKDVNTAREYFRGMVQDITERIHRIKELCGHSNIVSYEDYRIVEHADGHGWDILVRMELLTPFDRYFRDHIANRNEVIKIGIDICKAMESCHQKGVIHGNIKLGKIYVSKFGDFKLGDSNISLMLDKYRDIICMGASFSIAPELYKGYPCNPTVDIYSLGLLLYKLANKNRNMFYPAFPEMITFQDRDKAQNKRMMGEVPPYPVDAQDELGDVIRKACAYSPSDRYQTAAELRTALEQLPVSFYC